MAANTQSAFRNSKPESPAHNTVYTKQAGFSEKNGTLYVQLAGILRQRIRSGQWQPGTQLPTLDDLKHEFGVARVTLRQALSVLESEGLVWRQRGRGTFVSEQTEDNWLNIESNWDHLVRSLEGRNPRIISASNDAIVPGLDQIQAVACKSYRHMQRVHEYRGRPYAVIDIYLDQDLYQLDKKHFDQEMVIPRLKKLKNVEIAEAWQTITIGSADQDVATHLEIPIGAPIGVVRRIITDTDGAAIYIGDLNYRGDSVRLDIKLTRTS